MHDPAPSMINLLLHIFMFLHLMLQNFINDLYAKIVLGNWFSISSLSFRSKMVGKIILLLKNYVKSRYFHKHKKQRFGKTYHSAVDHVTGRSQAKPKVIHSYIQKNTLQPLCIHAQWTVINLKKDFFSHLERWYLLT